MDYYICESHGGPESLSNVLKTAQPANQDLRQGMSFPKASLVRSVFPNIGMFWGFITGLTFPKPKWKNIFHNHITIISENNLLK